MNPVKKHPTLFLLPNKTPANPCTAQSNIENILAADAAEGSAYDVSSATKAASCIFHLRLAKGSDYVQQVFRRIQAVRPGRVPVSPSGVPGYI